MNAALAPNHHAHHPQFRGPFGYAAGLTMIVARGDDARLLADLANVDENDHVLDIGCGPGTAARAAARRGARVTGVDPAEPMLRLARLLTRLRPSGDLTWVKAGAESLPIVDDDVTACWSIASVHHWNDLDASIAEVRRVLAPGGAFIAAERRSKAGAGGMASHGWTPEQAEAFASMLTDRGFTEPSIRNHELRWHKVVTVSARA